MAAAAASTSTPAVVTVAVRIRPPFEDEVQGEGWRPAAVANPPLVTLEARRRAPESNDRRRGMPCLSARRGARAVLNASKALATFSGAQVPPKTHEHAFNHVFGPEATQAEVYDAVGGPARWFRPRARSFGGAFRGRHAETSRGEFDGDAAAPRPRDG